MAVAIKDVRIDLRTSAHKKNFLHKWQMLQEYTLLWLIQFEKQKKGSSKKVLVKS